MAKSTKEEAHYREGTEEEHCGECTMFREPDACISVEGTIYADDVCDYYKKASDKELLKRKIKT